MTVQFKGVPVTVPRVRLIELTGIIDETLDPAASFEPLARDRSPIVIDLRGVHRITSFGVRRWVDGLRYLDGIEYFFIHCRPALVWQFNMILGFGGKGRLLSMFLPYTCSKCGEETEHLLDLCSNRELVIAAQPPEQSCTKCGMVADFDEDPGSYFGHASALSFVGVPAAVAALLDDTGKTASIPLKIRKEVTPEVTAVWLSGSIQDSVRFKRIADGLDGSIVVVAQDVHGVTSAGLTKLFGVLTAESAHVYLARATLELAKVMLTGPLTSRLPIVSLWIGMQCNACGDLFAGEFDRARWLALSNGVRPRCRRCGRSLDHLLVEPALAALLKLQLAAAPPVVASYLASRSEVPQVVEAPARRARTQSMTPLPQLQLDGYEIMNRIGIGGMAEVILARQIGPQGFNKLVALKRILPALATDPLFVEMFLREARIAALISHANVVQIYDLRESAEDYCIVMEYVPGWNLDQVLKIATRSQAMLPIELACRIVIEICAGLFAAHTATLEDGRPLVVVHRDVSPHNVLVSKSGAVKLTDFGIAKATNVTAVTKTDGLKGKFLYMAPERFEGNDSDTRSDIFSAGLILFLCLTQSHPFQGASEYITWENAVHSIVPPPSAFRPDVPAELDELVARAVARAPCDRYQTAQELQLALERFLATCGHPATTTHLARWLNEMVATSEVNTELDPVVSAPTTPGFLKPA